MSVNQSDLIPGFEQFEPDVFWQNHGRKVVWGIVSVAAICVVAFLWQKNATEQAEAVAARLAAANDVASLQRFVQDYRASELVAPATIRLGDLQFQAGQYTEAGKVYQQFLNQLPQNPLAPSAMLGLAAVQEAQGNYEAARSQYAQLAASNPSGYVTLAARMGAARCTELLGQTKEARQLYEELIAAAQNSPFQSEAYLRWTVLARQQEVAQVAPPSNALPLPTVVP